jgi:AmmeMemoRadiSam system protein A
MPGVCGTVDTQQAARVLAELIDDQTLVVASSDLSHYHPYEQAHLLDTICTSCICQLDTVGMQQQEACGKTPILVLMHLAKLKHWKPKLLDLCNSGDRTGDHERVVGYAAIAFYEEEPAAAPIAPAAEREFQPNQRQLLLRLARDSVTRAVRGQEPPQAGAAEITHPLDEARACFVTLREGGQLRGCIGSILPQEPLYQAVVHRAADAALKDPRFVPVQPAELPKIDIEVSVLTLPQPLKFSSPEDLLAKLRPRIDGVVLRLDGNQATFLPQVWEELPGKVEFLDHLSQKAGRAAGAWRNPGTEVLIYQVVAFQEKGGG